MARTKGTPKTGGRQRGTPNKLNRDVREMILNALDRVGGEDYLVEQARENPRPFLILVGRVLPLQVTGKDDRPLTLEELVMASMRIVPRIVPDARVIEHDARRPDLVRLHAPDAEDA